MPKKKAPRNAFFYFMLDFKARCERNGDRFPNGLRDVQEEASPEWNAMSPEAKKVYEEMAKEEKVKARSNEFYKETCMRHTFGSIEQAQRTEEDAKFQTNQFIESTIMSLSNKKSLAEYRFYLIHVNYFCVSEGECYHPAELAVSEFSLGEGVTNVYHTIIDPGPIPLGYRMEAIDKSNSSHKIPFEDNGGQKNFYNILSSIQKFLEPGRRALGGEYPPMYTMPDNVNINTSISAVKSVMETLSGSQVSHKNDKEEQFRIYPIEKLFLELQNACCKEAQETNESLKNISVALMQLESDGFSFTQNIACEFHQKQEAVEFCSRSYVQRWAYLICDHCCQFLNITLMPGRHIPENVDSSYSENRKIKEQEEASSRSKDFTWNQAKPERKPWVPVEQPPLPLPTKQANLAAMLPTQSQNLDRPNSANNHLVNNSFEGSTTVGRGRNQKSSRGSRGAWGGRGGYGS